MAMSVQAILEQFPVPFQDHCKAHVSSSDAKGIVLWDKDKITESVADIEKYNGKMESRASIADTLWKVATVISLALLAVTLALGFGLGVPMGPLFLIFALVPATTAAMSMWQWIANQAGDLEGKELAQKVAGQLLVAKAADLEEWNTALIRS